MNPDPSLVYRYRMRLLAILTFLLSLAVAAQPDPPGFCFVLAEDDPEVRPLLGSVAVEHYFQERIPYVGLNGTFLGVEQVQPLHGGPLFRDSIEHWLVYRPVPVAEGSHLLVIQGADTMRIDLSNGPVALIHRAWRHADRDTPEVIRFRKGRYVIEQLVNDPWAVGAANAMAERLLAEDSATAEMEAAKLDEYYRDQPPVAPPTAPYTPPSPMTEEDWMAYWKQRPPLKEARILNVNADTVQLSITGRIMLTGGCASSMPLLGMEMRTDIGWVERFPLELVQMDCGLPWGDWEDHTLTLPLHYRVGSLAPPGKKELVPGTYRFIFMGGNMERVASGSFRIE